MKINRIMLAFVMLTLVFSLIPAGCQTDSLKSYEQAVKKTGSITSGQMSGNFTMKLEFNTEGMAEDELRQLNYYKSFEGSFNNVFDHEAPKSIFRNYFNMGGLGFDSDLYQNGAEIFIKMPIIGKYLRINDLAKAENPEEPFSAETLESISNLWLSILQRDDVFRGEKIILTTPDGEVKATRYIIRLRDDQAKRMAKETMAIIAKDEKLKKAVNNLIQTNTKQDIKASFEEVLKQAMEELESCLLENFVYEALVDIDGYIVKENVDFSIKFNKNVPGSITELLYKFETKKWNINREQHFEFPVLTPENTLDQDTAVSNMPFVKDLFNKQG